MPTAGGGGHGAEELVGVLYRDPPSLITRWEFADGVAPDPADTDDARLMGQVLGRLHLSMAGVGPQQIPMVAALAAVGLEPTEPMQLLHGDFNRDNLRRRDGAVRVFDFDGSGHRTGWDSHGRP